MTGDRPRDNIPDIAPGISARELFGLFARNGVFALHGDLANPTKLVPLEVENVAVVDPYRALALIRAAPTTGMDLGGAVYVSLGGGFYVTNRRGKLESCSARRALHDVIPEALRSFCLPA